MRFLFAVCMLALVGLAGPSRAETPEEWVQLGARVHGGFGSFLPVGIRIGLARDAELRGTVVQPVTDDRDHEPVAVRQRLVGSPSG